MSRRSDTPGESPKDTEPSSLNSPDKIYSNIEIKCAACEIEESHPEMSLTLHNMPCPRRNSSDSLYGSVVDGRPYFREREYRGHAAAVVDEMIPKLKAMVEEDKDGKTDLSD